jgi:hypothetical protein
MVENVGRSDARHYHSSLGWRTQVLSRKVRVTLGVVQSGPRLWGVARPRGTPLFGSCAV